jgi:hypothetical protein
VLNSILSEGDVIGQLLVTRFGQRQQRLRDPLLLPCSHHSK